MIVNCVRYEHGARAETLELDEIAEHLDQPDSFVWVGLRESSEEELAHVQRVLGLHELAIEDAHHAHQRPKLEEFGDGLFLVLRTAGLGDESGGLEFGETHCFATPQGAVTVRHGPSLPYTDLRARCEAKPGLLATGPGFVLYAVMDFVVDNFHPIVERIEEEIEELESSIFGDQLDRAGAQRVYHIRRDLLALKHAVAPIMDICVRLTRFQSKLVPLDLVPYFRDVYDHAHRLNESVDAMRDLLTSALEAHLSLVAMHQNDVMRRLAAWAAIIAAPTFIASLFGMNLGGLPGAEADWGFGAVLAMMIVVVGGLVAAFRRSNWL